MNGRTLLCLLVMFLPRLAAGQPDAPVIAVQPLGHVTPERIQAVLQGLRQAYGVAVEVVESRPMPKEAWYPPRGRYRAEKLLEHLNANARGKHRVVIGITEKDISTTKEEHEDWGIFGLGELDGRACVVSVFRLGARGADERKLRERLRKIAIHEVGHVTGLPHCALAGCVMRDAESSIATVDEESGAFCDACRKRSSAWFVRK